MPLYKTMSGRDKQIIVPRRWTLVRFRDETVIPLSPDGWNIYGAMIRIEYPAKGCPSVVRGRLARWPGTAREDLTGFDDKPAFPGAVRHSYWSHFLLGRPDLEIGFQLWHDGKNPIVLDGRQFKWTRFN